MPAGPPGPSPPETRLLRQANAHDRVDAEPLVGVGEFRRGDGPPDDLEGRRVGVSRNGEARDIHLDEIHYLDVEVLGEWVPLPDDGENYLSGNQPPRKA